MRIDLRHWLVRTAAAYTGIVLLGACDAQPTEPPHGPVARIIIYEGDQQVGPAGTVLPSQLAVLVTDERNHPVPDVMVDWSGGGFEPARSATDLFGVARSRLTLPQNAGVHSPTASIEGRDEIPPAVFTATSIPGSPSIVLGSVLHPPFGTPLSERTYYAMVTDDFRNPVPGIEIEWKLTSGGGTVQPDRSSTGEGLGGRVTATHRLGAEEGVETVMATALAVPGSPVHTFETRVVTASAIVTTPGFDPEVISVPVGRTVAWLWGDDPYGYCESFGLDCIIHNVTFADDAFGLISSPTQGFGFHYQTFNEPGTYEFICTVHGTSGVVTVQ